MHSRNKTNNIIRSNVLNAIERHGLSEKDIASALEIPVSKVIQLLNGQKLITIADIILFCNYIDVSLESMLDNKEQRKI